MKKLKHLFVLGLLALLPMFSAVVKAQQDITYDEFYESYSTEFDLADYHDFSEVQATEAQQAAIDEARAAASKRLKALRKAFLYHEDVEIERRKSEEQLRRDIQSILTEQQVAELKKLHEQSIIEVETEAEIAEETSWDVENYIIEATDFFMDEYKFLDISPEQATKLAEKQAAIFVEDKFEDYDLLMATAHEEVLTPAQYEKYLTYKTEQAAANAVKPAQAEESEQAPEEYVQPEPTAKELKRQEAWEEKRRQREAQKLVVFKKAVELLKSYYIPERAIIRAKLEASISESDRAALASLRERHAKLFEEKLEMEQQEPNEAVYHGNSEMHELQQEIEILDEKEILQMKGSSHNYTVKMVIQEDRTTFYQAKELAIRYDKQIDEAAKENDLLLVSLMMQLLPLMPMEEDMPENPREEIMKEIMKSVYQTEEVEYWRNISFLFVSPGEFDPNSLHSNRTTHEVSIFPVPANEVQTLSFTLANDGMATVEVVSQDGKLLKTLQTDSMQKGAHQLQVDVRDIPAAVYFYRITTAEGTSLVKGMKAE